jgi:hypothetical protein
LGVILLGLRLHSLSLELLLLLVLLAGGVKGNCVSSQFPASTNKAICNDAV